MNAVILQANPALERTSQVFADTAEVQTRRARHFARRMDRSHSATCDAILIHSITAFN